MHVWQESHSALLQQTPSVQWLYTPPHSPSRPHASPAVFFARQTPPPVTSQYALPTHCVSSAQPPRQPALPPHVYGAQPCVAGIEQLPSPLHFASGWNVAVSAQNGATHWVPAAPWVQAPPVQVPVLPQGGLAGQRLCGSDAPSATLPHEPDEQLLHVPQEDALQQKPSTQKPVVHSWPSEHVFPDPGVRFGWHVPFGPPSQ